LLDESSRINRSGYPGELVAWQPHLRAVTDRAMNRGDERGADLCNGLGYHLDSMGDYDGARPYYEKALEINRNVLGEEHPDTATSLNNLGALLRATGDYDGARPYYEKAYSILVKSLGANHPNTTTVKENLEILNSKIRSLEND
jgi:tetratricopeptide (TPR) repeat protein